MNKILKGNCISCKFRHNCWHHPASRRNRRCVHWKVGMCYSCIYNPEEMTDEKELEWAKRGCEAEYPGGCRKYKRDWKKFFSIRKRIV